MEDEKDFMARVSYGSTIEILMYAMVYTGSNIAHVVNAVNKFMSNSSK